MAGLARKSAKGEVFVVGNGMTAFLKPSKTGPSYHQLAKGAVSPCASFVGLYGLAAHVHCRRKSEPALSQRLGRPRWRTLASNTKRSSSLTVFVR